MLQTPMSSTGTQPALLSRELLDNPSRLIDLQELCRLLGTSKSTVYAQLADPSSDFPRPIKLGHRNRWPIGETIAYLDALIVQRDTAKAAA